MSLSESQHAAVAAKDPDGKLVLWSSTQTPHYVHRALAKTLAMPAAHIRPSFSTSPVSSRWAATSTTA